MTSSDINGRDSERLDARTAKQRENIKGRTTGVTSQQKRDMVRYLESGLAVGRKRELLILDLAKIFEKSDRQIERYVESVGREAQRRVAKLREDHNRSLAWIAGMLRDNAVKLKAGPEMPPSIPGGIRVDYAIVGSITETIYYVGSFNPLIGFEPLKYWYVDASAATCLLAHLNKEYPELGIHDWWAIKKENITQDLMDALRTLAARQSFAPAEGCPGCRAIEEAARA